MIVEVVIFHFFLCKILSQFSPLKAYAGRELQETTTFFLFLVSKNSLFSDFSGKNMSILNRTKKFPVQSKFQKKNPRHQHQASQVFEWSQTHQVLGADYHNQKEY